MNKRSNLTEAFTNENLIYYTLFDNARDIILLIDPSTGDILGANKEAERTYGYSQEELLSLRLFDLRDRDDEEFVKARINGTWEEGLLSEATHKRKDGSTFPVEFNAKGFEIDGQKCIISIIRDIGRRNEIEEKLRESEERFKKMAESTTAGIFIYKDDKLIYANPKCEKITGYSNEELLSMEFINLIHPDFRSIVKQRTVDRMKGKQVPDEAEYKLLKKTDEECWVVYSAGMIKYRGELAVIGTIYDITLRKKAELALTAQEHNLRTIIESSPEALTIVDMESRILNCNQKALTLYGYSSKEELIGKPALELIAPSSQDKAEHTLKTILDKGIGDEFEFIFIKKDGTEFQGEASLSILFDEQEMPKSIIGISKDISGRKQKEKELLEKTEFIQTILDKLPIGVALNNIDDGFATYINKKFEETYGWQSEDIRNIDEFFEKVYPDTEYRNNVRTRIIDDIKSGEPDIMNWSNIEVTGRDGMKRIVNASNIPLYNQNTMVSTVIEVTAEKNAERMLKESLENLRAILESSPDSITHTTLDGTVIQCNQAAVLMHGYSSVDDMVGRNLFDTASVQERKKIEEKMEEAILNGGIQNFELTIIKNNNTIINTEFSGGIIYNEQGKAESIVVIMKDISERKKIEKELHRYREHLEELVMERTMKLELSNREVKRLSQVVEQSPVSAIITNTEGVIVYVNKSFEHNTGFKSLDALGNTPNILKSGFHDDVFYEELWKAITSGNVWKGDIKNMKKSGELFWERTWITPIRDEKGEIINYAAAKEDITKQKEQEEALRVAYNDLKQAHDKLDMALIRIKDTQMQLVQSEKMVSLGHLIAGIAHEINSPLGAIKSQNESFFRDINSVMNTLPPLLADLPKDLRKMMFELMVYSDNYSPIKDSSEERKHKRELIDHFSELGFKNPLKLASMIINLCEIDKVETFMPLLEHDQAETIIETVNKLKEMKTGSVIAHNAIESIMKIVFALKSFARSGANEEKEMMDITNGIDTVLTLYHNKMKHAVNLQKKYKFHDKIPCYPNELNQVWTNLLHNALQAMDFNGDLSITVQKKGDFVVTDFKDSGKGIPENIKSRIFEPFFTNKPLGEGTGLGLGIVQTIVKKHNGRISFESKVGIGSTFRVELPVK